MDIAIVTGAETPLGLSVIERLIEQGCRVHGIGNNFSKFSFADPQFVAHAVDLSDLDAVRSTTESILESEKRLHILVHAIDVTPGTPFRKLPLGNLEAILKIGLLGPVMLTRMVLPNLMRYHGQLINIIPTNKSGHPASAVNALIEGGLSSMNTALFDQARDAGLRITNLFLRQNTELPPATASDGQLIQSRIDPDDVANTIERLLDPHVTNVPHEINLYPRLSPQASTELPDQPEPLDPYSAVILPPKEYCPPEPEPIPTKQPDSIERVIPYTDEEMEERIAAAIEEYEANPEQFESKLADNDAQSSNKKRRRRRGGRSRNKHSDDDTNDANDPSGEHTNEATTSNQPEESKSNDDSSENTRKPRRRRGGRNRNKNRDEQANEATDTSTPPQTEQSSVSVNKTSTRDQQQATETAPKRRRSGRNRGRSTNLPEVKDHSTFDLQAEPQPIAVRSSKPKAKTPEPTLGPIDPASSKPTAPAEATNTEKSEKAAVKKKAAKKSAKKKAAKKKAAKKPTTKDSATEAKTATNEAPTTATPVVSEQAVKKKAAKKKATKKATKKKAVKKKAAKKKAAKKVTPKSENAAD